MTNISSIPAHLPIDPDLDNISHAYAFWKCTLPPYLQGDIVAGITPNGLIIPEHRTGNAFKPVYITTLQKGLQIQKNLDTEFEKYKKLTSEANKLIKIASDIKNLISSVS